MIEANKGAEHGCFLFLFGWDRIIFMLAIYLYDLVFDFILNKC